jgi:hypothetical protein
LSDIADQPSQKKKIMPVPGSQPFTSKGRSNPIGWSAKKPARIAQAAENGGNPLLFRDQRSQAVFETSSWAGAPGKPIRQMTLPGDRNLSPGSVLT